MARTRFIVSFGAHRIPGGMETILPEADRTGVDVEIDEWDFQDIHKVDVKLEMDDGDPRIPQILEALRKHDDSFLHCRRDFYTEDDLQSAPLVIIGGVDQRYAFGGQGFAETTYDLSNACPNCGTGARQTSPLFIDAADVKKIKPYGTASTCYSDLFVKEKVLARLEKAGITDFSTRDVNSRRKNGDTTQLPRKQIIPNHVLPPLHRSSQVDRARVCPQCHRGGYLSFTHDPLRLAYRAKDVVNVPDFNFTWEWFGEAKFNSSVNLRFARPYILVTPKVMNILREKEGEGALRFTPIHIVED